MNTRLIGVMLLLLGVTACGSAPPTPTEYYVLAPSASMEDRVVEHANKPTVVIENVELAAYLKQPGLIIQSGSNQLTVSRNHLWAESLELALPKALVRDLQQQSDNYSYYLKSLDWVGQADYRLRLRIDSLQATDQGEVVTSGRYQVIPGTSPASSVFVDFNFHRDLQQDGYTHTVEQMQVLLSEIAGAILGSLDSQELEPGTN
jgi:uncharacterized lipoprotein YmbA